jgi:hypothetical protein
MKPGSRDIKVQILITGQELEELQKHTWSMAESFGLDRRIDQYMGKKPIGLYRWDLEWLIDVLDFTLNNLKDYPYHESLTFGSLKNLSDRLKALYGRYFD